MQDAQQDESLTIAEAAAQLGVSTDTVRRRIRRGELAAQQVTTPNGPAWRVMLGWLHSASPTVGNGAHSAMPTVDGAPGSAAMHVEAPLLARLLADTQAELVRTTAVAAMWQERCQVLEARLQALPPPTMPSDAPQRDSDATSNGAIQESFKSEKKPWWRFWAA